MNLMSGWEIKWSTDNTINFFSFPPDRLVLCHPETALPKVHPPRSCRFDLTLLCLGFVAFPLHFTPAKRCIDAEPLQLAWLNRTLVYRGTLNQVHLDCFCTSLICEAVMSTMSSEVATLTAFIKPLTNPQLKDLLRYEGLQVSGLKATLQFRIIQSSSILPDSCYDLFILRSACFPIFSSTFLCNFPFLQKSGH